MSISINNCIKLISRYSLETTDNDCPYKPATQNLIIKHKLNHICTDALYPSSPRVTHTFPLPLSNTFQTNSIFKLFLGGEIKNINKKSFDGKLCLWKIAEPSRAEQKQSAVALFVASWCNKLPELIVNFANEARNVVDWFEYFCDFR